MMQNYALERKYVVNDNDYLGYTLAKKWTVYGPACQSECHSEHMAPMAGRNSWFCYECEDKIRRDLFALAGCWGFLEDLLQRGPGRQGEGGGGNKVDAAAPLDLEIAEIRRAMTAWCWSMIEHMLEDKPAMSPPEDTNTPAILEWIGRWHVQYIATHPDSSFPPAMQTEIADMVGRVRARLFPSGIRRQRLPATCSRILPDEDATRCRGQLWALLHDSASSTITCEADPSHEIPQSEWLHMLKAKTRGRK